MTVPTPVLSLTERARYHRCLKCAWHPPTQGHHPNCLDNKDTTQKAEKE